MREKGWRGLRTGRTENELNAFSTSLQFKLVLRVASQVRHAKSHAEFLWISSTNQENTTATCTQQNYVKSSNMIEDVNRKKSYSLEVGATGRLKSWFKKLNHVCKALPFDNRNMMTIHQYPISNSAIAPTILKCVKLPLGIPAITELGRAYAELTERTYPSRP